MRLCPFYDILYPKTAYNIHVHFFVKIMLKINCIFNFMYQLPNESVCINLTFNPNFPLLFQFLPLSAIYFVTNKNVHQTFYCQCCYVDWTINFISFSCFKVKIVSKSTNLILMNVINFLHLVSKIKHLTLKKCYAFVINFFRIPGVVF